MTCYKKLIPSVSTVTTFSVTCAVSYFIKEGINGLVWIAQKAPALSSS
jgi:hypothetical protein